METKKVPVIPGVGELMLASFPHNNIKFIPTEWWIGEKYDGLRCCWNPDTQTAYTRYGRYVSLPKGIRLWLPTATTTSTNTTTSTTSTNTTTSTTSTSLVSDCELWHGRGHFSASFKLIVHPTCDADSNVWCNMRILLFDVAAVPFQNTTFEHRYTHLMNNIHPQNPIAVVVWRVLYEYNRQIKQTLKQIIHSGGEGIILRKTRTLYEHGKSHSLIKFKTSMGDREAIVSRVFKDKSLELKLPNGIIFVVARQQVHIPTPLVGEIVSFSHEENARRDIPVKPIVFRVRSDLSWENLVVGDKDACALNNGTFTTKSYRYWNEKNMREFFINYAKQRHLEPLMEDTWHTITSSDILRVKGGGNILNKFNGYYDAIKHLFPEIKFSKMPGNNWTKVENRKKFFDDFALKRGFDPLLLENWNSVTHQEIMQAGGSGILYKYYGGSHHAALASLYSFCPSSKFQLPNSTRKDWTKEGNRKQFFDDFATKHAFDALVAENWRDVLSEHIKREGGSGILRHYGGSHIAALSSLYSFDKEKVKASGVSRKRWTKEENRKRFFDEYAQRHSFDALVQSNWYSVTKEDLKREGGRGMLEYYGGSHITALSFLYSFNPSKLRSRITKK